MITGGSVGRHVVGLSVGTIKQPNKCIPQRFSSRDFYFPGSFNDNLTDIAGTGLSRADLAADIIGTYAATGPTDYDMVII